MSTAFRNKAQQFAQQVISDVRPTVIQQPPPPPPAANQQQQSIPAITTEPPAPSIDAAEPQAYHEESRLSEYGMQFVFAARHLFFF